MLEPDPTMAYASKSGKRIVNPWLVLEFQSNHEYPLWVVSPAEPNSSIVLTKGGRLPMASFKPRIFHEVPIALLGRWRHACGSVMGVGRSAERTRSPQYATALTAPFRLCNTSMQVNDEHFEFSDRA